MNVDQFNKKNFNKKIEDIAWTSFQNQDLFFLIKVRNAKIYPLDALLMPTDAGFPHLFEGDAKKPVNNVLTYPRWVSKWSTAK